MKAGLNLLKHSHSDENLNPIPVHHFCRNCGTICCAEEGAICPYSFYFQTPNIHRCPVRDKNMRWNVRFDEYRPVTYTSSTVIDDPQADKEIDDPSFHFLPNSCDGSANRLSRHGIYKLDKDGRPLNPCGRTGLCGRGSLKFWGPNHFSHMIITRWKRNLSNGIILNGTSKKPVLQFIAIRNEFLQKLGFIEGILEMDEKPLDALKRKLKRQIVSYPSDPTTLHLSYVNDHLYEQGAVLIHSGYLDDSRNTDNSWIETWAFNFHDEDGIFTEDTSSSHAPGDCQSRWFDAHARIPLFCSHKALLCKIVCELSAHW